MVAVQSLAYVVVESTDIGKWSAYATGVLGMEVSNPADGLLNIKMDDQDFRFQVVAGESDRLQACGWLLSGQAAFDAAVKSLRARSHEVTVADAAVCKQRRVSGLAVVVDPSGNRHELVWGVKSDKRRFVSPQGVSGFLTGEMGMGHAVLPAPNFDATFAFLRDELGFAISDVFNFCPAPGAPNMRIFFMHCNNPRHHSLAIMEAPHPAGCVHLMVEVDNVTEVGLAHDRMLKSGTRLSATLGQHSNDRMVSFYMKTPGGFDIEYGCGGLNLDWSTHAENEFTAVSLWGHDFSVGFKD